jgi:hypothetical protein
MDSKSSLRTLDVTSGALARCGAALMLSLVMSLSAIVGSRGVVEAQTASLGTAEAAIAPETSAVYFGLSLDTKSAQWTLAQELLKRAGIEQDPTSLVNDATSSATGEQVITNPDAFLGGEAALVLTNLDALSGQASSLEGVVSGGLGVATPTAGDESTLAGAALVLKPSDLTAATQQLDNELNSEATSRGDQVTETDYSGTTIKSVPSDSTTGTTGTAYAVVGEFLVVSETPTDIEPFIDTAAGTINPLSNLDAFSKADAALTGDRLGFGFLNGSATSGSVGALDTSGLGIGNSLEGLLGTDAYTGLSVIADPAGFRFNTVEIPASGRTSAGTTQAPALTFADKVPEDSLVFANGMNLGKGVVLQGLGLAIVSAINGVGGGMTGTGTPEATPTAADLYAQTARLIGFNLKTDFIDQLTGEYGLAAWNINTDDPAQINALLTSGTASPATVSDALSKLSLLIQAAGQGQATVTTKTIANSTVSVLTIPQDGGSPIIIEYGVVNGEFLLSFGNALDNYIAGISNPLSQSKDFQDAFAALPAEHTGVFYLNVQEALALDSTSMTSIDETLAAMSSDATPTAMSGEATPTAGNQYSAIRSFATVTYKEGGYNRTSSILLIA